jgi:hypothetical protein
MKIKVLGKPVIIINPFHAYQLGMWPLSPAPSSAILPVCIPSVPYTTKGHSIILFEARSTKSWEELRQKLTGTTDPKDAAEGSIRNLFLKNVRTPRLSIPPPPKRFSYPLSMMQALLRSY